MKMRKSEIENHNARLQADHTRKINNLKNEIQNFGNVIDAIIDFQIAIPSWALGTGGTRFGRFAGGGEPRSIEEKIEDVGLLHTLTRSCDAISLHIPWDIPTDPESIKSFAKGHGLQFDAVNSNTFQDQPHQKHSYKFGSLQHVEKEIRKQAVQHNLEVIDHGIALGSKSITVWLSDGSCFPGQLNFKRAFENTLQSLKEIYKALPTDWKLFVEYKAYEPNFYSMTVGDWGQAYLFTSKLGPKAFTLVDLGHHLPNTNIEQIVALLMMEHKLGGFHFNDSKYGDDDLTAGSIKPYQLFLIFNELIDGIKSDLTGDTALSWMIDASHNVKDPLEDLLQSVEAILIGYTQALLVNRSLLAEAQNNNDAVSCQEILQNAFRTDVRPLLAEARLTSGGVINPIEFYREIHVRETLIRERGKKTITSGL